MKSTRILVMTILLALLLTTLNTEIILAEPVQKVETVIEEETESEIVVMYVPGYENETWTDEQYNTLQAEIEESKWETYTLTAYCGCSKCCGKWATGGTVIGSGGVPLIEGYHCASPLKNGTKVYIEGLGTYEVQDSTADWIVERYSGKIIDIYFENHNSAIKFGKRTARVKVEG